MTEITPHTQATSGNEPARILLSIDQIRYLDFELFNGSTRFSWSPKAAFDAREASEVGESPGFETLYDYLTKPEYVDVAANTLLEVAESHLPRADVLLTIYRAADSECGSDYDAILPGASVTTWKTYAIRHAELHMSNQHKLMSTKVYPDELVTRGDAHEFTYVPRSLAVGFQRYTDDVKRERAKLHS